MTEIPFSFVELEIKFLRFLQPPVERKFTPSILKYLMDLQWLKKITSQEGWKKKIFYKSKKKTSSLLEDFSFSEH